MVGCLPSWCCLSSAGSLLIGSVCVLLSAVVWMTAPVSADGLPRCSIFFLWLTVARTSSEPPQRIACVMAGPPRPLKEKKNSWQKVFNVAPRTLRVWVLTSKQTQGSLTRLRQTSLKRLDRRGLHQCKRTEVVCLIIYSHYIVVMRQ